MPAPRTYKGPIDRNVFGRRGRSYLLKASGSRSWAKYAHRKIGGVHKEILEARAMPKSIVNGTILERIVAKQVHDRGYVFVFQLPIDLPQLATARMDVAVFGTGIGQKPVMDIECQGAAFHTDHEADRLRRLQIEAEGYAVVQIWEADLTGSIERMNYAVDLALRGIELPRPASADVTPIAFNK